MIDLDLDLVVFHAGSLTSPEEVPDLLGGTVGDEVEPVILHRVSCQFGWIVDRGWPSAAGTVGVCAGQLGGPGPGPPTCSVSLRLSSLLVALRGRSARNAMLRATL